MFLMHAAKCQIEGSDYIGAFITTTENYTFCPVGILKKTKELIKETLQTDVVEILIGGCSLIGILCRGNSKGIAVSNLASEEEIMKIREACPDIKVEIVDSNINAIGNGTLVNDKVCFVSPDYDQKDIEKFEQIFGTKVFVNEAGGYKTVGANNIITINGMAINNHATDAEKNIIDKLTGFESVRTTANRGGLSIGIAAVANSKGILTGYETTGFEMNRLIEALEKEVI
jgi:translation initiation factor 6